MRTLLATLLASSVIAGCGGGGDETAASVVTTTPTASVETPSQTVSGSGGDSTAAEASAPGVADKYVGTWVMCVTVANISYKITMIGTKVSATSINYTYSQAQHSNSNCAGTGTNDYTEAGSIVYQGTKTIGTDEADKGEATITADSDNLTVEPRTEKDVSLVSGNMLYHGDKSASGLDSEGYPNALFRRNGFTKQ